jgi:hypothetical protein
MEPYVFFFIRDYYFDTWAALQKSDSCREADNTGSYN